MGHKFDSIPILAKIFISIIFTRVKLIFKPLINNKPNLSKKEKNEEQMNWIKNVKEKMNWMKINFPHPVLPPKPNSQTQRDEVDPNRRKLTRQYKSEIFGFPRLAQTDASRSRVNAILCWIVTTYNRCSHGNTFEFHFPK